MQLRVITYTAKHFSRSRAFQLRFFSPSDLLKWGCELCCPCSKHVHTYPRPRVIAGRRPQVVIMCVSVDFCSSLNLLQSINFFDLYKDLGIFFDTSISKGWFLKTKLLHLFTKDWWWETLIKMCLLDVHSNSVLFFSSVLSVVYLQYYLSRLTVWVLGWILVHVYHYRVRFGPKVQIFR